MDLRENSNADPESQIDADIVALLTARGKFNDTSTQITTGIQMSYYISLSFVSI
jgi:hypothetical protein